MVQKPQLHMYLQLILKSQKRKISTEVFTTQSPFQEYLTIEIRAILKTETDPISISIKGTFASTIPLSYPFKAIESRVPYELQL